MRKMVPDPPHSPDALQDTLIQTSEYVICALSVARQSVQLNPTSPNSIVMQAVVHEMESAYALVETALVQLQMQAQLPAESLTLQ